MKAIRTRFYGATNTRGSRIIATDGDRNSISLPYPHELNSDDAHRLACLMLQHKMKWTGQMISGGFRNDTYWVFANQDDYDAQADKLVADWVARTS